MKDEINWHVSYEEAEARIHDTVNQIYEHNLNDPSMTREEALESTAASAEKGLEYLEEFQEAENEAADAAVSAAETGPEDGPDMGPDDGMDDGIE